MSHVRHIYEEINQDMLMKRFLTLVLISFLACAGTASAQKFVAKTNTLYWLTTTPNAGLELAMADRWTFELAAGYNPWTLSSKENIKVKHFLVTPEVRYWFCEAFLGHFIGLNGNYTQFNVGGVHVPTLFYKVDSHGIFMDDLQYARSQGWAAGAGLTYGYSWPIARRWNMEFTVGLGWWYTEYDKFESRRCGMFLSQVNRHVVGLTDLGLSFIYLIK